MSKDSDQKDDVPDNIVRVDFGRARAVTEVTPSENPSTKQVKSIAPSKKEDAGVLSFGDPRAHERLRLFSEWIAVGKVMRLDFSLLFGIAGFVYDRDSVRCTLSFGGKESYCVIPWAAILMMYAHETRAVVFFDEDISEPLDEFEDSDDSDVSDDSDDEI